MGNQRHPQRCNFVQFSPALRQLLSLMLGPLLLLLLLLKASLSLPFPIISESVSTSAAPVTFSLSFPHKKKEKSSCKTGRMEKKDGWMDGDVCFFVWRGPRIFPPGKTREYRAKRGRRRRRGRVIEWGGGRVPLLSLLPPGQRVGALHCAIQGGPTIKIRCFV